MRKKVSSVDTIRRENGDHDLDNNDTKENQELPQTTLDKKSTEISDTPLNGTHNNENDHSEHSDDDEEDDKDSSLDQDEILPQQELPTSPNPEPSETTNSQSGDVGDDNMDEKRETNADLSDCKDKLLVDDHKDNDKAHDAASEAGHDSTIDPETGPSPSPNPEEVKEEKHDPNTDDVTDNDANPDNDKGDKFSSDQEPFEPPQHPIRYGKDESEDQQQPENLHLSPQNVNQSPQNLHQSPGHPLNLHQSPAHPSPRSPTPSDPPSHPFHRPPSYHPTLDTPHTHGGLGQYSAYAPTPTYNQHYFNNANNNYNGQSSFPHPFAHNFSAEARQAAEQHEMYMTGSGRSHLDSHHSSHLSHPGLPHLGHFSRMGGGPPPGGDPYNFPNSDDELCSPTRGSNPLSMGFSGMPMPLIAPKAQKPRKPRKPRSPKPEGTLSMQIKEDSRSGDFSDELSFDDDDDDGDDGDGKLVIAEGDDLDIKMEGLGEDGKVEKKQRRKHNRFNGMSEEEVMKRLLPDLIVPDLDILIVGINPGLYAAFKQHHYAGPGNHFWKCLFLSGLVPRPMNAENDKELLSFGIGFTNIVERTTRANQELTRQEIEEGAKKLVEKIKEYNPKIAVFNGKGIYEVFSGEKEFIFGKQPQKIADTDTYAWVMPNSSARCAQLPRAVDKVPFYVALKKFRDHLRGDLPDLEESEVTFPEVKLQNFNNKRIKEEGEGDISDVMDGDHNRIDPETGKKRRGRPPKPRADGSLPPPKKKRVDEYGNPLPKGSNPIDPVTGKKKRGRPKKSDMPPVSSLPNGLERFQSKDEDSDIPSSKTPIKLPPFSPNFGGGGSQESESDKGSARSPRPDSEGSHRLHGSHMDPVDGPVDGPKGPEEDDLPDLSARLCQDPGSPALPPSPGPGGHPLGGQYDHQEPRSLHEEETSHSSEDRRPDSARSLTRPQIPCGGGGGGGNFSNPTTPVDGHSVQNYQNQQQQRFSPFQRGGGAPHHSPNYHPGANSFHAPYRSAGGVAGTPPHRGFDSPQPRQSKPHDTPGDVSTKSLTGLESLVDQIPAIAENDSGVFSGSGNGSHPPTPRSVGPYSPGQYGAGPNYYQQATPGGYNGGGAGPGNTPNSETGQTSYQATDLSTSTNYGHGGHAVTTPTPAIPAATPTNFSVSSLAHSSVGRHSADQGPAENGEAVISSHPFLPSESLSSVSSLSSEMELSKYSPAIASTNPYMSGMANHSSMFGAAGSLMSRSIGPPNSFMSGAGMGSMGSMAAAGMGAMAGMAGMYGMSNYAQQYSSAAAGAYSGAFAAAASAGSTYPHGLHMPNPSYPYPSPYSQSPYSQSPYF